MKFIIYASRILSAVFSPLMMATYGMIVAMTLSFLCFIPASTKLAVIFATFIATVVIPVIGIFILSRFKVIKDPRLNDREDRTWPYILEIICFLGTAVYLYYINAPTWLPMFMIGGAVALIVLTVVNRWWKISGHATGMGGLCALVYYLMMSGNSVYSLQWGFMAVLFLAGAVCSARLVLERHTLAQVAAGFLNGFVCVIVFPLILQATQLPQVPV